jgi:DNA-binding NarL/FixJ family response regulator
VRPRSIDRDRVAKLVSQGLTNAQIAERLGCRKAGVVQVKAELGLTKKQAPRRARVAERVA